MPEFPTPRNDWKLDAVGLLAVIGETTTEACVEAMKSSWQCFLPRLIPTPQALIRPHRRITLPRLEAVVQSVYTGTTLQQLSYVGNLIYPINKLDTNSVHGLKISRKQSNLARTSQLDTHMARPMDYDVPPPASPLQRRSTPSPLQRRQSTFHAIENKFTALNAASLPVMKANPMSPHNLLSILSCLWTIGLLIWAIIIGDAPAMISVILLAAASTLFCAASFWRPMLSSRRFDSHVPQGDIVIRTRAGAFVVVKCDEEVAREIYFAPDEIRQFVTIGFGACIGVGTIVFMVAVIMLGNCTWTVQAAFAGTCLVLNAIYWVAALLPGATHWTFPRYD